MLNYLRAFISIQVLNAVVKPSPINKYKKLNYKIITADDGSTCNSLNITIISFSQFTHYNINKQQYKFTLKLFN